MKEKKYTYKDWWDGKVYLKYCPISYDHDDKNKIGKQVDWNNFRDDEVIKIKSKQKEIFEEIRQTTLQKYKGVFLETYKKSKFKALYFDHELEDLRYFIYGPIGNMNLNDTYLQKLKNRVIVQTGGYFSTIEFFINEYIKKGRELSFDFIHSPNYKYQFRQALNPRIPAEIFALVCLDYYQWLIDNYQKTRNKTEDKKGNEKPPKEISQQEIANKAVLTFKELIAYTGYGKSHLYKLTSAGKIPHSKPTGKLLFFKKAEIDSWLMKNKIKTAEEIDVEAATHVALKGKN